MAASQIDITLSKGKSEDKSFKFTNNDGTVYDMTGSTVVCELYMVEGETPVEITGTIDVALGKVTIPFTNTHSAELGFFEYKLVETKVNTSEVELLQGNITVVNYVPFTESIESFLKNELPVNCQLTGDFKNQKILYWKRFLQEAFGVSDANLYQEDSWPVLARALIAKLVWYDALLLCTKGSYVQFIGGDFTQPTMDNIGGPIQKIETGPSNVEFHSLANVIDGVFSANAQGVSAWDNLLVDICGLASKLRIKLPMCKDTSWKNPYVPTYYQNPDWAYPTLDEYIVSVG